MKKINLIKISSENKVNDGYKLNPNEQYIINLNEEFDSQMRIMSSFQIMGYPPAIKNYHAWLFENGFDINTPSPTNEMVAKFFGNKPLWKTEYSQGIVVKAEEYDDYFIIMECSNKNKGFKHTIIILTMGGCI